MKRSTLEIAATAGDVLAYIELASAMTLHPSLRTFEHTKCVGIAYWHGHAKFVRHIIALVHDEYYKLLMHELIFQTESIDQHNAVLIDLARGLKGRGHLEPKFIFGLLSSAAQGNSQIALDIIDYCGTFSFGHYAVLEEDYLADDVKPHILRHFCKMLRRNFHVRDPMMWENGGHFDPSGQRKSAANLARCQSLVIARNGGLEAYQWLKQYFVAGPCPSIDSVMLPQVQELLFLVVAYSEGLLANRHVFPKRPPLKDHWQSFFAINAALPLELQTVIVWFVYDCRGAEILMPLASMPVAEMWQLND